MKKIFFLASILCIGVSFAQVTEGEKELRDADLDTIQGWKSGGLVSLNMSQVSLSNWNAGGQNSISLNGLVSVYAHLTKGKSQWENTLDLGYGVLKQGRAGSGIWQKTDDKIDLVSKYGRKATNKWYYSGLLNFNTQSTAGYNYPNDSIYISNFMAPGYMLLALGMDYKPNKKFSAFIAPFTMKGTFVNDEDLANAGAFGVEKAVYDGTTGNIITPGKRSRFEMGGYLRVAFSDEIMKNVNLTTKLGLFSNYLKNPERVDVNWETLLQFKVNKFISATLSTHLIYDDDIDIAEFDENNVQIGKGPRLQFKEVLSIGFSYKF